MGFEPFVATVATAEAMVIGDALFPGSGRAPGPFAKALAGVPSKTPVEVPL